jgi:hypothetical protein
MLVSINVVNAGDSLDKKQRLPSKIGETVLVCFGSPVVPFALRGYAYSHRTSPTENKHFQRVCSTN